MDDLETAVSRLAKVRSCSSPNLSPDGDLLAFVSSLSGTPQAWIVSARGGWPRLVTDLDDPVLNVAWSPRGDWLAIAVAPGGGLNSQVYRVRPDGTGLERLSPGGTDNNWLGGWTRDGRLLHVASSRRTPEAMDVWLVDPESNAWRLAARNDGIGRFTDVSADGRRAVLYRMVNRSDSNLFAVDVDSGAEVCLTPHSGPGNFDSGRFSPDGQTVYLISDAERERPALARVRLDAAGQPGPMEVLAARDDADLESLLLSWDGRTAALFWNSAGRTEMEFYDTAGGALTPGPALPAEVLLQADLSADGRRLALNLSGATTPGDIWVLDRPSGELWQATHSPRAGVNLKALVKPELRQFSAHDGLPLSGWFYRPPQSQPPYPVVFSFHGGPEGQERPWFSATYQALLGQGIAVFAPNVRGSTGFGKTFVNLDNGPLRVNAVRDIRACVEHLTASGLARPGRLGIMGGSYGGFMTMAGLTEYPQLFAAGTTVCGVFNFETFFANTEPWMAAISTVEYGDPATQADLLRSLSPVHKIDRLRAPTLVLHGGNDTNVPVVEAEQVVSSLQARGVPVAYVLFPDEGHGFRKIPNRVRAAVETVRWFARHLAGD